MGESGRSLAIELMDAKSEQLQRWALVAEIVGGMAVLVTLLILIVEVRGNTNALRAQELGVINQQNQAVLLAYIENSDVYTMALTDPKSLSIEENMKLTSLTSLRLNILQRHYLALESGIINRQDWESRLVSVPIYLGSDYGRVLWENVKGDFAHMPQFVEDIDKALAEGAVLPDDEFIIDFHNDIRQQIN